MRIAALLSKLFNLRSGEWNRLLLLYTMSLVVLTGCNWADAIVQGAFLQLVGVQYLPWVFISCAACSIGALFIYSAFADRVSNTRLLIAILVISGAGILLGLVALAAGLVAPAYLLLFLVLNVPLFDLYNIHWATYVNGFYDIRTAKRIVPVLSTSARLAGIIAGLSMPLMNKLLSPVAIIGVSMVSLAIMAILAAAMPRLLREKRSRPSGWSNSLVIPQTAPSIEHNPSSESTSGVRGRVHGSTPAYGDRLREGYQQIKRSPFLRWMALSTFSMTLLLVLLNYGASAIFQAQLKTTVAISDFLGILSGLANLVVLPIQLFLLSRLITRLGLGNASLVYPLASLVSAGSLAIAPSLGTAALAYLDRTALRTAFRIPTDNLFYNAVPLRVKARTRAFVGGLVVPVGAILGGLLLLTPLMRMTWFLPVAILTLGLVFTMTALMVRCNYGQALVDLLEQEDYSSLALQAPSYQEPSLAVAADPATLASLEHKLRESTSHERTIFMAQLITAVGGEAAVPIVRQAVHAATDVRLRASLVDVLVAADVRRGRARELYAELLADSDGQVRLSAIGGLEQIDGPRDGRYLELAARLLADPEIEVRLRLLPALLAADDPDRRDAGTRVLRELLNASRPTTRARALQVVGQARLDKFLPEVARSLADDIDEVRLAAALASEMLVDNELAASDREALLESFMILIHDPIERVRLAAVTVLGQLGIGNGLDASTAREKVVAGLADPSPEVRERAVEALVGAGHRAIPLVQRHLNAADPHLHKMAAVVLARIEPRKYTSLIRGPSLECILFAIYQNLCCLHVLSVYPGTAVAVLKSALREWNAIFLDEIFSLLSSIHDPAAVRVVENSFHSPQQEVRANAAEAFEVMTSPKTALLVSPLFELPQPSEQVLSLAKQTWDMSIPTPAAAMRLLLSDASNTWQRILAAAALAELSSINPALESEFGELLSLTQVDPDLDVRPDASHASTKRTTAAPTFDGRGAQQHGTLSLVEKLILLKDVPFFQCTSIDKLRVLASVCEEEFFPEGEYIYNQGDMGGTFYIVVSGCVGIDQEKRKGIFARLATVEPHSYLGESEFFDNSCRVNSAIAVKDTLTLCLRREPLIALARQQPDLSLELIIVLSGRLREANDHVAELTRTHSRELQNIFDELM
jgi:CRP/FNR family cyclic AMP-dependent transcriptional regulator